MPKIYPHIFHFLSTQISARLSEKLSFQRNLLKQTMKSPLFSHSQLRYIRKLPRTPGNAPNRLNPHPPSRNERKEKKHFNFAYTYTFERKTWLTWHLFRKLSPMTHTQSIDTMRRATTTKSFSRVFIQLGCCFNSTDICIDNGVSRDRESDRWLKYIIQYLFTYLEANYNRVSNWSKMMNVCCVCL